MRAARLASYIALSARATSSSAVCRVPREGGDADATPAARRSRRPALNGWPSASTTALAERQRRRGDRLLVAREVLDHEQELVAAVAAREDVRLEQVAQAGRGVDEHLVAVRVAERVVDELDAVDVAEQQRDRGALTLGALERGDDAVLHRGPVGQPGQVVAVGEPAQLRDDVGLAHGADDAPLTACAGKLPLTLAGCRVSVRLELARVPPLRRRS